MISPPAIIYEWKEQTKPILFQYRKVGNELYLHWIGHSNSMNPRALIPKRMKIDEMKLLDGQALSNCSNVECVAIIPIKP